MIKCHAAALNGTTCDNVLGKVDASLTFVGARGQRPNGFEEDARWWIQCGRVDCRTWNVFEVEDDNGDNGDNRGGPEGNGTHG